MRYEVAANKRDPVATPEETLMKSGTFSLSNNKQCLSNNVSQQRSGNNEFLFNKYLTF